MFLFKKKGIETRGEKKTKKSNHEKKPIKPIKILKKLTGSVRFWLYKLETEKTKPNPNKKTRKKPSQTGLNRFLS